MDGRLGPCPLTPNCVTSEGPADAEHSVDAFKLSGPASTEWTRMHKLIENAHGSFILDQNDGYLRARFTTPLLRFDDDLELHLDPDQGLIQVRSASRVGRSDLGTNRRRVEALRARWLEGATEGGGPAESAR